MTNNIDYVEFNIRPPEIGDCGYLCFGSREFRAIIIPHLLEKNKQMAMFLEENTANREPSFVFRDLYAYFDSMKFVKNEKSLQHFLGFLYEPYVEYFAVEK